MSWVEYHTKSERLAAEAETAIVMGDLIRAKDLYSSAAEAEVCALEQLDHNKIRTIGISAVSAVSLWYKAKEYEQAQQTAYKWLSTGLLPGFSIEQLKELLQTIWSDIVRENAGIQFAPGQVLVSVKGGEVLTGGAPLDLIVKKVEGIQSLFYRTTEFLNQLPFRRHGAPSQEIQHMCRPWLFQTAPGSYQFAVAIEEPRQQELFPKPVPKSEKIAETFFSILRASVEDPDVTLPEIVPDKDYRGTFLKLTRNLAPTGKTFGEMEIKSVSQARPITLIPNVRTSLGQAIKKETPRKGVSPETKKETLRGVLRALHLDKDWLEIIVEDKSVHVIEVNDAVDDVIGPMVNHMVIIEVLKDRKGRYIYQDIQTDD